MSLWCKHKIPQCSLYHKLRNCDIRVAKERSLMLYILPCIIYHAACRLDVFSSLRYSRCRTNGAKRSVDVCSAKTVAVVQRTACLQWSTTDPPEIVHRKISHYAHKCTNRLLCSLYHIRNNSLCSLVQIRKRIHRFTIDPNFKMKMRSGTSSRITR